MKIIINGAGGRMGRALAAMVAQREDITVLGAVDPFVREPGMVESLSQCPAGADCILDFSNHAGTQTLLDYAVKNRIAVVVATTGHTPEESAAIEEASRQIPIFWSGNMSVGIAVLTRLVREAAAMFPDADIEIVESHHNQKLDVPSGTALMLARSVQQARPDSEFLVGRHENGKREKRHIGIHSLRMGNTVGIHEVIINTGTQILTLKHEAQDRALFAEGALTAAAYIAPLAPGMYNMDDLVK